MAKPLSPEMRKLRLELVDLAAIAVTGRLESGYYTPEQGEELHKQLARVAKFLGVRS